MSFHRHGLNSVMEVYSACATCSPPRTADFQTGPSTSDCFGCYAHVAPRCRKRPGCQHSGATPSFQFLRWVKGRVKCFLSVAIWKSFVDVFCALQAEDRMHSASVEIKAWTKVYAKDRQLPKWWKLSRTRLSLKTNKFVHLTGKAWHTTVVLEYLAHLFEHERVLQIDVDVKQAVWAANNFFQLLTSCRKHGFYFLRPNQQREARVMGDFFLKTYVGLHSKFTGFCPFKLFHCRPKLHLLAHMVLGLEASPRNPLVDAVWMDENFIGQVLRLARKTHCRTTHISVLYRYTAGSATISATNDVWLQFSLPGRSESCFT